MDSGNNSETLTLKSKVNDIHDYDIHLKSVFSLDPLRVRRFLQIHCSFF